MKIYEDKIKLFGLVLPTCDSCGDPKCSHKRKNVIVKKSIQKKSFEKPGKKRGIASFFQGAAKRAKR